MAEDKIPGMDSFQGMIQDAQAANNAFNAQQVQQQMDFQRETNKVAMDFNSAEAAKNRDWQKMMSDTSHQREVKDLIAAGLNPILAVNGGQGAPVGSGATAAGAHGSSGNAAKTDNSTVGALTSALNGLLQRKTQMEMADMSAKTNLAVADKYNAMSKYMAELQRATGLDLEYIRGAFSKDIAGINASASMHNADAMAGAQIYSANLNKEIQQARIEADKWIATKKDLTERQKMIIDRDMKKYTADLQDAASRYATDQSVASRKALQDAQQAYETFVHQNFPKTMWESMGASGYAMGLPNNPFGSMPMFPMMPIS